MKDTFKSKKGITLIALIITVILMLILASVALSAIGTGGLFDKTQQAADRYNDKVKEEKSLLENLINAVEKYAYTSNEEEDGDDEIVEDPVTTKFVDITVHSEGRVFAIDNTGKLYMSTEDYVYYYNSPSEASCLNTENVLEEFSTDFTADRFIMDCVIDTNNNIYEIFWNDGTYELVEIGNDITFEKIVNYDDYLMLLLDDGGQVYGYYFYEGLLFTYDLGDLLIVDLYNQYLVANDGKFYRPSMWGGDDVSFVAENVMKNGNEYSIFESCYIGTDGYIYENYTLTKISTGTDKFIKGIAIRYYDVCFLREDNSIHLLMDNTLTALELTSFPVEPISYIAGEFYYYYEFGILENGDFIYVDEDEEFVQEVLENKISKAVIPYWLIDKENNLYSLKESADGIEAFGFYEIVDMETKILQSFYESNGDISLGLGEDDCIYIFDWDDAGDMVLKKVFEKTENLKFFNNSYFNGMVAISEDGKVGTIFWSTGE